MFENFDVLIYLQEIYKLAEEKLSGDVKSAFQWANMTDVSLEIDGQTVHTHYFI